MAKMNKKKALDILLAVSGAAQNATQRDALAAVAEWVNRPFTDLPDGFEERRAMYKELKERERKCMSGEEVLAEVAFLLENVDIYHPQGKTRDTLQKLKKLAADNIAPELIKGLTP